MKIIGGGLIVKISEFIVEDYMIGDKWYHCEIQRDADNHSMNFALNEGLIWMLKVIDMNSSNPDFQMCAHYEGSAKWIISPINYEVKQLCDSLINKYNCFNPILRDCKH